VNVRKIKLILILSSLKNVSNMEKYLFLSNNLYRFACFSLSLE